MATKKDFKMWEMFKIKDIEKKFLRPVLLSHISLAKCFPRFPPITTFQSAMLVKLAKL